MKGLLQLAVHYMSNVLSRRDGGIYYKQFGGHAYMSVLHMTGTCERTCAALVLLFLLVADPLASLSLFEGCQCYYNSWSSCRFFSGAKLLLHLRPRHLNVLLLVCRRSSVIV